MSVDTVRAYLVAYDLADRVLTFDTSSATVALAAQAVGCEPAHIVKTLSFKVGDGCVLICAAGDARVDNAKYKACFGEKARMLTADEAEAMTGHAVGGVTPFAAKDGALICLDASIKRFDFVYPAAGSASSAVKLRVAEMERALPSARWVDVCKGWAE